MKQRIKVVLGSDAALDGQAVRAWLQYDTKTEKTIKECRRTFAKQLGLHDADTVELIIEGFVVLDSLSSDTLDPSKDIIEIRRKQHLPNGNSRQETPNAKRRKLSAASKQDILPQELLKGILRAQSTSMPTASTSSPATSKLPLQMAVDYSSDASTSSSSSSDSSSSFTSSSSSSSSSESSSSSSNSSSTSSSSSSSGSSSSRTHSAPSQDPAPLKSGSLDKPTAASSQNEVPPGQGKASTRSRNLRKRIRKQHLKRAAADIENLSGLQRPKVAEAARTVASALTVPNLEKPFAATPSTALGEPTALLSHRLQAHAGASNSPDATVLSHMSQTQREDLKMLSLASGNSKKAKSLRRDMLHGRRQTNKKIVYADGEAMSMDVTPDSSAILPNTSQVAGDASSPAVPVLNSSISYNGRNLQKPVDLFPNGITKRPPPPPPSTRTDLPANVVVTSVDVEAEDFVPGVTTPDFVAPPQVPHFTQRRPSPELPSKAKSDVPATTKATPDASAYFNAYSGYYGSVSQNGKGKQKKRIGSSKDVNVGIVAADVEKYAAKLDENHWQGWPTLENIETGLFETYKSVTAPGDGEQVAVKVLELSPTSFLPALSLYYGVVLSLTSSPHSSAIRLKLHPSCRPYTGLDQHKSHEDLVEGVETEPHYPRYFGEDLQSPLDDAEQPDIKEIKLDDIVDCRRIV